MQNVQLTSIEWAGAGVVLAAAVTVPVLDVRATSVPPIAWIVAVGYLVVSNALLLRGLRRQDAARFGPANAVTSVRSTLVGVIAGLVVASFTVDVPALPLVGLVVAALVLDAVDGWVARRTGSTSELGARFDMEVDAFLLLVLSVHVARDLGAWVLVVGLLRYAFVAAGWVWPMLRRTLPPRYWRKVVTAVAGIALAFAVTGLVPAVTTVGVAIALALLLESFGRDVVWLLRSHDRRTAPADGPSTLSRPGVG